MMAMTTAQRIKLVNDHGRYMHKAIKYHGEDFIPLMVSFMDGAPYVTMAFAGITKDKITIPLPEFMDAYEVDRKAKVEG